MKKIDFKKELKHLYNASKKEPVVVEIPEMKFLMVDGSGDPNTSQEFTEAIEALYGVSYTLKFMIKNGDRAVDYGVLPLEGLFWAKDMVVFATGEKDKWIWTLMIMQPEYVTEDLFEKAVLQVEKKKNPPAISKIRFETYQEGLSAQLMHIGLYSEEGPNIERLHSFIKDGGHNLKGKHHEIYLSDPRRSAPEKMKTIIRQPVQ